MTITVELDLTSPYDLTAEEIEKDLRMAEGQIGWNYDYTITDVKVTTERKDILIAPIIGYHSWLCRRCFSRIIEGQKVCDCCGYGIRWS